MLTKLRYRLDLTGTLQANRVEHDITIGAETKRSFALPTGAFYAENFVLIDKSNPQKPLERGKDYQLVYLYDEVSKMAKGKEICGVVVVFNKEVGTELTVHANIVGANFVNHYELLTRIIEDLDLDNREVEFWRIEGIPTSWIAAPHLQDIGDIFGFEFHISILAELVAVVSAGATPELEAIISSLDSMENRLSQLLQSHIDAKGNVHQVTPGQIGTYSGSELDGFFNQVNLAINAVAEATGENANSISVLDNKLEAIKLLFVQHTETLASIREDFGSIESYFGSINTELARLKGVDEQQQVQINSLLEDLARNWEDQAQNLEKINKNIEEIAAIKQVNTTQSQQIAALQHSLNNHIAQYNGFVTATNQWRSGINQRLQRLDNSISNINNILQAQHQEDIRLNNLIVGLNQRVTAIEYDNETKLNDVAGVRIAVNQTVRPSSWIGRRGITSEMATVSHNNTVGLHQHYSSVSSLGSLSVGVFGIWVGQGWVPPTAYNAGYFREAVLDHIEVVPINSTGKFVALDGRNVSQTNLRNDRQPNFGAVKIYANTVTVFFKRP